MDAQIDLKNLERKAWTSYYQDGLWDIYLGLLMWVLALLSITFDGVESTWTWLTLYFILAGGTWLLFWAGRRFITIPRLGRVRFGAERRKKKTRLALVMGAFVLLNVLLIFLTLAANNNPRSWGRLMPEGLAMSLLISAFVGSAIAAIAYFNDFNRGYYIALVFALTFFAVEVMDNPAMFWVGGIFILIPGLVLLLRFLQQHPLPPNVKIHEHL